MSDVRCLSRPDVIDYPETSTVPRDPSPQARATRQTLLEFVRATSIKPLWLNPIQHEQNAERFLDTMTLTERVFIECEMQTRNAPVHSFEYDPIKN